MDPMGIGLYNPIINLPFGDCAMYFDHGIYRILGGISWIPITYYKEWCNKLQKRDLLTLFGKFL